MLRLGLIHVSKRGPWPLSVLQYVLSCDITYSCCCGITMSQEEYNHSIGWEIHFSWILMHESDTWIFYHKHPTLVDWTTSCVVMTCSPQVAARLPVATPLAETVLPAKVEYNPFAELREHIKRISFGKPNQCSSKHNGQFQRRFSFRF